MNSLRLEASSHGNFIIDVLNFLKKHKYQLIVLTSIYLLINILYYIINYHVFYHLIGDAVDYNAAGKELASHLRIDFDPRRLPGFSIWVAIIYKFFGKGNYFAVFVGNILLAYFVGLALYAFSYHFLKNRFISIFAFCLFSINPIVLCYNFKIMSEWFTVFMILFTFVLFYLTLRYKSLLFLLFTTIFYIISFFTKYFMFFVFPFVMLFSVPSLIKRAEYKLLIGFIISILFAVGAYQHRVHYVNGKVHQKVFTTLSQSTLNTRWISTIIYYDKGYYKTGLETIKPGEHYFLSDSFNEKYKQILSSKGSKAAHFYRFKFIMLHWKGLLMNTVAGITDALFMPSWRLYYGSSQLDKVPGLTDYQEADIFYLIHRVANRATSTKAINIAFILWCINIFMFLIALLLMFRELHVKLNFQWWHLLLIIMILILLNPVEVMFSSFYEHGARFRVILSPFISFMYSVALWSVLKQIFNKKRRKNLEKCQTK